jgi:ATPase subunit of ABC transporter with duplicated ATPase domains
MPITLDGLTYISPDGRTLFEDLTLAFGPERTGLVGRYGAGKTSLLRLILGEIEPTSGAVTVTGRLAVLRQNPLIGPDATIGEVMGLAGPLARLERIETGEGSEEDFAQADWELSARLVAALAQTGLPGLDLSAPAATLSGGQLTRAALAGLVVQEPDMLLLDEPTNNLDAEARDAVARVLAAWRGGAIVVSHDRTILRAMDRIVELTGVGVRIYGGNYDLYAARKTEEEDAAAQSLDEAQRALRATERELQAAHERKAKKDAAGKRSRAKNDQPKMFLDFQAERAEGTGSRIARTSERLHAEASERLAEAEARVERVRRLAFELPSAALPASKPVLSFDDVSFAWPGEPPLLSGLTFHLSGPQRLAVVGPNGAGKTTLLRLASGELTPSAGRVRLSVQAAVLDQRAALLNDDETLVQNFLRLNPRANLNAAQAALARFLFRNVAAGKRAGDLSGGERLRAALACVLFAERPPQLLILDEPTNHLDLDSITAIEAALAGYDGALLVVSHDEDFLAAAGIGERLRLARARPPS